MIVSFRSLCFLLPWNIDKVTINPLKDITVNMSKYPSPAFRPKRADSMTLNPSALRFLPIRGALRSKAALPLRKSP